MEASYLLKHIVNLGNVQQAILDFGQQVIPCPQEGKIAPPSSLETGYY